jgi:hypothetical protein
MLKKKKNYMTYFAKCNVNLYLEHFQVFLIFYSSSTHKLVCTEKKVIYKSFLYFYPKSFFLGTSPFTRSFSCAFLTGNLVFPPFSFLSSFYFSECALLGHAYICTQVTVVCQVRKDREEIRETLGYGFFSPFS